MNLKKAKALRRQVYSTGGSRKLRKHLMRQRTYVVKKDKVVKRETGERDAMGEPVIMEIHFITVGVQPGSLRAQYLALKRAA